MDEIYWITRLDGICGFLTLISVFSAIATIVLFFIVLIKRSDAYLYYEDGKTYERHIETSKMCFYFAKRCAIAFFVSVSINAFTPTTNDALLIYGLGGTIDYIKSNETAKQLPDKYIKALDKWVGNLNEEKQENKQK